MWRPGDPRPAPSVSQRGEKEERGRDGEQRKRREKKAPPPKPGGTSQLSNATLGMKFMQRRAAKDAEAQEAAEKARAEKAVKWRLSGARDSPDGGNHGGLLIEEEETDPRLQWLGRRSFGGFNPALQTMWEQNCRQFSVSTGKRKRDSGSISAEEMVSRYEAHGTVPVKSNPVPPSSSSGGGNKKGRYMSQQRGRGGGGGGDRRR